MLNLRQRTYGYLRMQLSLSSLNTQQKTFYTIRIKMSSTCDSEYKRSFRNAHILPSSPNTQFELTLNFKQKHFSKAGLAPFFSHFGFNLVGDFHIYNLTNLSKDFPFQGEGVA